MDPEFEPIISGAVKFAVWRVEKFKLVKISPEQHGTFYSGDSYLVFNGRKHEIFYWIGSTSSIDERTTVAIKAVELDDSLGGVPVQYREMEGYETEIFKNLFPEGIVTLSGGCTSGLKKTQIQVEHETRLFKVSGGRVPILSEVEISWSRMNHGDTFVLDTGTFIFVWRGRHSSGAEGLAGAKLAARLRNKVGEEIVTLEDGEEDEMKDKEKEAWERFLKLEDKSQIRDASRGQDKKMSLVLSNCKLYRCQEQNGELLTEHMKTGNLSRSDLTTGDSYVVEAGPAGVWAWLGTRSSKMERRKAMEFGEQVIKESNLPAQTRLTRINMNQEPEQFKSLFASWS